MVWVVEQRVHIAHVCWDQKGRLIRPNCPDVLHVSESPIWVVHHCTAAQLKSAGRPKSNEREPASELLTPSRRVFASNVFM